jgi:hypothetical protein
VQDKRSEDDYKNKLLAVEEKRVKIGKNEAIIKLAMAIQSSFESR